MNRAVLYEELHYTEGQIVAGEKTIEKQRQDVQHLEAQGHDDWAALARTLLGEMEQAQAGHIADRDRIRRLLAA